MSHTDISAAQDRPRPLLRRQRPAVGVLLPQRLRLRRGRLRRPGNQGQARGRLRPAAGRHHLRPRLAAAAGPPREPAADRCTATACRTSPWKWTTSRAAYDDGRRPRGASASRRRRRWRTSTASTSTPPSAPTATRRTRFVNRDRYRGVFAPGYKPHRPGPLQPADLPPRRPARRSTTSSATLFVLCPLPQGPPQRPIVRRRRPRGR